MENQNYRTVCDPNGEGFKPSFSMIEFNFFQLSPWWIDASDVELRDEDDILALYRKMSTEFECVF